MIQKELGHLIIPPIKSGPLGPKLNDIWATGQQLIICYGDNDIVQGRLKIIFKLFNKTPTTVTTK